MKTFGQFLEDLYLIEQESVQGSLFTRKGTPQNFRGGRTPFVATDPIKQGQSSPLPTSSKPPQSSPGQLSLNVNRRLTTSRPGATVRATGPNMDKFPQLQRFTNQGANVLKQVSKAAAAARALRTATPLGAAAAVMSPTPTGDATLTGALKRGDYKPKQGPRGGDEGLTRAQSFDKAFKSARRAGKSEFEWRGGTYTTKVK